MKHKFFPIILLLCLFAGTAFAADGDSPWQVRCNKGECEIAQRLSIKQTAERYAEFAIGYPDGTQSKARGVVILPLGIMVEPEIAAQIDGQDAFTFRIRSCSTEGCFGYLALGSDLMTKMKNGGRLSLGMIRADGRPASADFSLKGFTAASRKAGFP